MQYGQRQTGSGREPLAKDPLIVLRIGNIELGAVPRVAVPLTDAEVDETAAALAAALRWADVVELRVDMFASREPQHVASVCEKVKKCGAALLVTVRSGDQGGARDIDDSSRLDLYRAALPFADAFDVELHSPICDDVLALAAGRSLTTIASHHDFATTPAQSALHSLLTEATAHGADIVKIAATAHDSLDRNRLLDLLRDGPTDAMIVIAMGEQGAASRVFFPLCGSLLTYGFLNEAVAPGQMSIRALHSELARYSPDFAAAHS